VNFFAGSNTARCLQALLKKLGGRGLEEVLDNWILECREDLTTQATPFRKFLQSSNDFVYGPDERIEVDKLRQAFRFWCQQNLVKTDAAFTDDIVEDGFAFAEKRLMNQALRNQGFLITPRRASGDVAPDGPTYDMRHWFKGIGLRPVQTMERPAQHAPAGPSEVEAADQGMGRPFLN